MDFSRIYPLPEVISEGWEVTSRGRPGISVGERKIIVPLGVGGVSHCLRMQQVARVKWDDGAVEDVADSVLFRALEDNRLSLLMDRVGIDITDGFLTGEVIQELLSMQNMQTAQLSLSLLTAGTGSAFVSEDSEVSGAFREVQEELGKNPTKGVVRDLYERLKVRFTDMNFSQVPSWGASKRLKLMRGSSGEQISGTFDEFFQEAWDDLEEDEELSDLPFEVRDELPDGKSIPSSLDKLLGGGRGPENLHNFVPWGVMSVEEPGRSISIVGKMHKRWRPVEEGVYPRYNHRLFMDQRIFGTRKRLPGGTVVIDASGSMRLTQEQINLMVNAAPGCTVACYSGMGDHGVLRILARNGMSVGRELCMSPCGGGNIVDYPALKWAYKQKHPRIWVSDFSVTGVGDSTGHGNKVMCAAVVQKGRFFTAPNADEAIKVLQRLSGKYRS